MLSSFGVGCPAHFREARRLLTLLFRFADDATDLSLLVHIISRSTFMPQENAKVERLNWQAIAALVAVEQSPERILTLSKELIRALDEEDGKRRLMSVTPESKKSEMLRPQEMGRITERSDNTGATRATARIRCPYCVENGKFREMVGKADGRMVCNACSHVACPSDPDYRCNCSHCTQLDLFTPRH